MTEKGKGQQKSNEVLRGVYVGRKFLRRGVESEVFNTVNSTK